MARPLKRGVDYFPKDTDFYEDDKVRTLRGEFGAKGMYLLDYILCDLYGKNGYYMLWDKNKCFLVSDGAGCGCNPQMVNEVISGCIRCGLFDKTVFDMFGVLTSAGIQRRFIRMLNGRENFTFIQEYFLLDINDTNDVPQGILNKLAFKSVSDKENPVLFKENPVLFADNTQSKIEQNKLDYIKSKVEDISQGKPAKLQKHKYGEYNNVLLDDEQIEQLKTRFPSDWKQRIEELSQGIELKGYKYKNHYLAILKWSENSFAKNKKPAQKPTTDYDAIARNNAFNAIAQLKGASS